MNSNIYINQTFTEKLTQIYSLKTRIRPIADKEAPPQWFHLQAYNF